MKILLADKISPVAIEAFEAIPGAEVVSNPSLTADDLPHNLNDVEILVVRSTKVTKDAIEAAPKLGLIIRAGSGYNTIDVACATEHNVRVANCPGKNSVAVAELAMGLLLSIERRIPDCVAQLRAGKWNKKEFGKADGLKGKTVGLVGTGNIGSELIKRLRGFEVDICAYDICLTEEKAAEMGIKRCENLMDVAKSADIISIHVPSCESTRGMINAEFIAAMKPQAILLNTSRADIVDNDALLAALDSKGLRCGLDVFPNEPGTATADFDCALAKHPNCYGSHHIGASTAQAERVTGLEAARIAKCFAAGDDVPNCVNPK
ncbi:MAG: 3-phosphoglycerate dehydrogenase [bacterium]|nr:3-phosphoglycerate dehydrogenase [bacterium]